MLSIKNTVCSDELCRKKLNSIRIRTEIESYMCGVMVLEKPDLRTPRSLLKPPISFKTGNCDEDEWRFFNKIRQADLTAILLTTPLQMYKQHPIRKRL